MPSTGPMAARHFQKWTQSYDFRMAADGRSCFCYCRLSEPDSRRRRAHLRDTLHGNRTKGTLGLWRPARVRNMIVNKTNMGIHEYGKRWAVPDENTGQKHLRVKAITRDGAAIVDE